MGMFTAITVKGTFPGDTRTWEGYFSTKDLDYYRHPFVTLTEDFELISSSKKDPKIEPNEYHQQWVGLYHCTDGEQHHFKAYIEQNHIVHVEEISEQEVLFSEEFE